MFKWVVIVCLSQGISVNTQGIKKSKLYRKQVSVACDAKALSFSGVRAVSPANSNRLLDLAPGFFSALSNLIQPVWQTLDVDAQLARLVSEIDGVCTCLLQNQYSDEYTRVARYVFFAVADDLIATSVFGKAHQWDERRLLKKIYQDEPLQDKFFLILEKVLQEANVYMDLLELMYICLQMGYQGMYRYQEQVKPLSTWVRAVYHCLSSHRGRVSQRLAVGRREAGTAPVASSSVTLSIYGLWASICFALLLFVGSGFWMNSLKQHANMTLIT